MLWEKYTIQMFRISNRANTVKEVINDLGRDEGFQLSMGGSLLEESLSEILRGGSNEVDRFNMISEVYAKNQREKILTIDKTL